MKETQISVNYVYARQGLEKKNKLREWLKDRNIH